MPNAHENIPLRLGEVGCQLIPIQLPIDYHIHRCFENPCPCGYYNHPEKECVCGPGVVKRYVSKISGPLLDRIDLHVEVTLVSYDELTNTERAKLDSTAIRERVLVARAVQDERLHLPHK